MTDASKSPPIVEFLTARLDEQQRNAEACAEVYPGPWELSDRGWMAKVSADEPNFRIVTQLEQSKSLDGWLGDHLAHIASCDPTYMLADIAAKRAVMEIHKIYVEERRESPNIKYSDTWKPDVGCVNCDWDNDCRAIEDNGYPCNTVKLLASPYATHPGYQQEWAVVSE